jgi:hypothetical protein
MPQQNDKFPQEPAPVMGPEEKVAVGLERRAERPVCATLRWEREFMERRAREMEQLTAVKDQSTPSQPRKA